MFSQLAYYLKNQLAEKVIVIAQQPIVSILRTHPDIDQVIAEKDIDRELKDFDYWVYPHEIPVHFKQPFSQIPKRIPYLSVDNTSFQKYSALFKKTGKPKVGITWKGNPTHENDIFRSIHNLEYIEQLFQMDSIDWYCIQKECNEEEIKLLKKYNIPHLTKNFTDFTDTAAVMKHLDLFITIDSSVAHLAGALGLPTFVLLSYFVDWRWGTSGESNFWYPTVRSFRNTTPTTSWYTVITNVQKALVDFFNL